MLDEQLCPTCHKPISECDDCEQPFDEEQSAPRSPEDDNIDYDDLSPSEQARLDDAASDAWERERESRWP